MANTKISALTALTSASDDDLLVIVDDPGGTAVTKKITVANFLTGITTTFKFADGAVDAPSVTFTSDTNTGLYRIGVDNIAVTLGGIKYIDIGASGGSIAGQILIGIDAAASSWTKTQLLVTNGTPWVVANTSVVGIGAQVLGGVAIDAIARTSGATSGIALYGNAGVNAAADTGVCYGVWGQASDAHTGQDNIGGYFYAATASSSGQNLGVDIAGGSLRIANSAADAAQTADANTIMLNGVDLSAGNTILSIRTEGTGITGTGTPTANRTVAMNVNGTTLYLLASTSAT